MTEDDAADLTKPVRDDEPPGIRDALDDIKAQRPRRQSLTKAKLIEELEKIERKALVQERMLAILQRPPAETELRFPAQQADAPLRIRRPTKWRAWVGPPDRLAKIAEVAEASLRAHFDQHATEGIDLYNLDSAYRLKVEVHSGKGRIQRSGPIRTSLSETNPREIESIFIGNESLLADERHLPVLQIRFGREESYEYDGISLDVADDDRDWVASTHDRLAAEIQRDVPFWARLRSMPARVALFLLTIAIIYGIAIPLADGDSSLLGSSGPLAAAVAGGWVWVLVRYVLRPLEVLETGRSSSARRTIAAVITVLGVVGAIASIVGLNS